MQVCYISCSKTREQKKKEAAERQDLERRFYAMNPGTKEKQRQQLRAQAIKYVQSVDTAFLRYEKYRKFFVLGYTAFLALLPVQVLAAGGAAGGITLIKLMQQASFWIGIGVVVWGVIEAQLDLPGWKGRILKGVLGYIVILLVPMVFITLRDNLQIDVWQQLENSR